MWTNDEKDYLKNNYKNSSATNIAKYLKRSVSSVENKINKLGLKKGYKRFYNVDLEFFNIPNLINCYWAGFIAADGTIRKKEKQLCLCLANKDKKHIKLFNNDICYNGPIKNGKKIIDNKVYKHNYINICGAKKIIDDLESVFNITAKKTFTLKNPRLEINNALSYIIGYIDGDGTIGNYGGRAYLSIVSGSAIILKWIKQTIEQHFNIITKDIRKERKKRRCNTYVYKITGYKAIKVLDNLNKFNVPKLSRKWRNIKKCKRQPVF